MTDLFDALTTRRPGNGGGVERRDNCSCRCLLVTVDESGEGDEDGGEEEEEAEDEADTVGE